jgi:hypothetical protein
MPVKVYVSRDSQGQPWSPDHEHEARSVIEIVKKLWLAFNSQKQLYAVAANLHRPSADLVILSERGIGIVELKHYYGRISRQGSTWYAGKTRIKAGSESKGYRNPHEQVQDYAAEIRSALIGPTRQPFGSAQGRPWLPGRHSSSIRQFVSPIQMHGLTISGKRCVVRHSTPSRGRSSMCYVLMRSRSG